MATVTYTVKKGDTLSAIAKKHNTTVSNIAKLNDISNVNLIYVGQVLTISGKSSTSSSSSSTNSPSGGSTSNPSSGSTSNPSSGSSSNSNTATITAFGLQSNTDRTVFATWKWTKSNTKEYAVRWYYTTGDAVNFVGNEGTETAKQSIYTAPANATTVKFQVKPISNTKTVNKKEVSYWTASWTTLKQYKFVDNPPTTPPVPTVSINNYTLTASLDNLDVNGTKIQFQIVKDDTKVFKTGTASIVTSSASYSCTIDAGGTYKVRCRTQDGTEYSDWSEYSDNISGLAGAPSITSYKATSDTSIYISWTASKGADTYEIQYATKEEYLDETNATTSIGSIKSTHYTITGLESGENYFIRVRAINGQGESGWSGVISLAIGKAPSAPTTWSSTTTAVVGENVILYWVHNTEDGSECKYSELELIINGEKETYTIEHVSNDDDENKTMQYILNTQQYTDGLQVRWKVRTAGVTSQFGDWSIQRTIDVYAPPVLSVIVTDMFEPFIEIESSLLDSEDNELTDSENELLIVTDYILQENLDTINAFPFYIKGVAGPYTQIPIGYHVTIVSNMTYETSDDIGNTVTVRAGDEVFSKFYDIMDDLFVTMTPKDINLENNVEYVLQCVVTMNSGLTAEDSVTFTVSWDDEIYVPNAEIGIDDETLSAHIRPYCEHYPMIFYKVNNNNGVYTRTTTILNDVEGESVDNAFTERYGDIVYSTTDTGGNTIYFCMVESEEPVLVEGITLSVYRREFDGSFKEIGTGLINTENTFVTDPHPSLDYARYRIVAISDRTGAISYADIPGYLVGEKAVIIQWDEVWSNFDAIGEEAYEQPAWSGSMLKLPYNIDVSDSNTSDVTLVKYIGRSCPVSYYGTQIESKASWNVDIAKSDKNTLYALRRLSMWMGDVYVREPSGSGYWASISVSFSQTHCETIIPVTLTLTRVEGGI